MQSKATIEALEVLNRLARHFEVKPDDTNEDGGPGDKRDIQTNSGDNVPSVPSMPPDGTCSGKSMSNDTDLPTLGRINIVRLVLRFIWKRLTWEPEQVEPPSVDDDFEAALTKLSVLRKQQHIENHKIQVMGVALLAAPFVLHHFWPLPEVLEVAKFLFWPGGCYMVITSTVFGFS